MLEAFVPMPTWRALNDAGKELDPPISRRTINRWIAEGMLIAHKLPGDRKHYVDVDAIEKLRVYQPVALRQLKPKPKAKAKSRTARRKKG